ncbi:MAG: phosphoenolpyruvate--protein phosphotransferase, partial [Lachnospiraceae bacterium]|nr:phosphoenolpyruvate--protein phosphotransferase [Lachnospiraceae bacterium]
MYRYEGKKIFNGIAIGNIKFYSKEQNVVVRRKIEDTESEIERFKKARDMAIEQLHELHDKAVKEVGEMNAEIFEVHAMMLEDDDYNESVENIINTQKLNAEYAVGQTSDNFAEMFANMDDE